MITFTNCRSKAGGASDSQLLEDSVAACKELYSRPEKYRETDGWIDVDESAVQLAEITAKAAEIRMRAEVFVVVGVGGSNQAARAAIKGMRNVTGPEIIYAGNTLSAFELCDILSKIRGRSVYIDVIAKNFETLEPGSHFRVLREYMKTAYSAEEVGRRTVLTGTRGSRLEEIADELGCLFLEFPENIGGRYSAFTPVSLLPMAVAGLDIEAYLTGARDMRAQVMEDMSGICAQYAAVRRTFATEGKRVELIASFEPRFTFFSKWWIQLFGESEGKSSDALFPSSVIFSEDLHSMGQYIQQGPRHLLETFIIEDEQVASCVVSPDKDTDDGFSYLDGMDFFAINNAAVNATIGAHREGGVPCLEIHIPRYDEYHLGMLYYFFMVSCVISCCLTGVNPFDQPGVEAYKCNMFASLKPNK